jgi:hypothetical protein
MTLLPYPPLHLSLRAYSALPYASIHGDCVACLRLPLVARVLATAAWLRLTVCSELNTLPVANRLGDILSLCLHIVLNGVPLSKTAVKFVQHPTLHLQSPIRNRHA